jgi:hypothetical protein
MQNNDLEHNLKNSNEQNFNFRKKIDPKETAQYIADMVLELRNMAKDTDLVALRNLLELCFYEAFSAANKIAMPAGEIEHLRELSQASKTG